MVSSCQIEWLYCTCACWFGEGPRLVLLSLSLWQHLGNISIAPCRWLLFRSCCTGQGECRDGSLCVRNLFTRSLYAGWRSRSATGCVCSLCSETGGLRISLLGRTKSLHEGGHSNSFLWVFKICQGQIKWQLTTHFTDWSWCTLWGRVLTENNHILVKISRWTVVAALVVCLLLIVCS